MEPLDTGLNDAIMRLARIAWPNGWDLVDEPTDSYKKLRAQWYSTGRIAVSNMASDFTIYGHADVNYAFRAWHDWNHLMFNHDFSMEGETRTCEAQCAQVVLYAPTQYRAERWCRLIEAEVIGQARYFEKWGEFPVDQRSFDEFYAGAYQETALGRKW